MCTGFFLCVCVIGKHMQWVGARLAWWGSPAHWQVDLARMAKVYTAISPASTDEIEFSIHASCFPPFILILFCLQPGLLFSVTRRVAPLKVGLTQVYIPSICSMVPCRAWTLVLFEEVCFCHEAMASSGIAASYLQISSKGTESFCGSFGFSYVLYVL